MEVTFGRRSVSTILLLLMSLGIAGSLQVLSAGNGNTSGCSNPGGFCIFDSGCTGSGVACKKCLCDGFQCTSYTKDGCTQ